MSLYRSGTPSGLPAQRTEARLSTLQNYKDDASMQVNTTRRSTFQKVYTKELVCTDSRHTAKCIMGMDCCASGGGNTVTAQYGKDPGYNNIPTRTPDNTMSSSVNTSAKNLEDMNNALTTELEISQQQYTVNLYLRIDGVRVKNAIVGIAAHLKYRNLLQTLRAFFYETQQDSPSSLLSMNSIFSYAYAGMDVAQIAEYTISSLAIQIMTYARELSIEEEKNRMSNDSKKTPVVNNSFREHLKKLKNARTLYIDLDLNTVASSSQ